MGGLPVVSDDFDVLLLHTSVGPAIVDGGSEVTLIEEQAVPARGDCAIERLRVPVTVPSLGTTIVREAAFTWVVHMAIARPDEPDALVPVERGAVIRALIVPRGALRQYQGQAPLAPVMLVGLNMRRVTALTGIFSCIHDAQFPASPRYLLAWTFPREAAEDLEASGTDVYGRLSGATSDPRFSTFVQEDKECLAVRERMRADGEFFELDPSDDESPSLTRLVTPEAVSARAYAADLGVNVVHSVRRTAATEGLEDEAEPEGATILQDFSSPPPGLLFCDVPEDDLRLPPETPAVPAEAPGAAAAREASAAVGRAVSAAAASAAAVGVSASPPALPFEALDFAQFVERVSAEVPAELKGNPERWQDVLDNLYKLYPERGVFDSPAGGAAAGAVIRPEIRNLDKPTFSSRTIAPQHRPGLWAETDRLLAAGFIGEAHSADGSVPVHPETGLQLFIHAFVAALKPVQPGQRPQYRYCLDVARFNSTHLVDPRRTLLPRVRSIIAATRDGIAFGNADVAQAYHQRLLHSDVQHCFGFRLPCKERAGRWRWFYYKRAFFGLAPLPGLFQSGIEEALEGVVNDMGGDQELSSYIDDLGLTTRAAPGLAFNRSLPVSHLSNRAAWADAVARHFDRWALVFRALRLRGYRLALKKQRFLDTESHAMGLISTGARVRIAPERIASWASLRRPEVPTLAWLNSFVGLAVYAHQWMDPGEYLRSSDVLLELQRRASRAAREKDARHASVVADNWTGACERAYLAARGQIQAGLFTAFIDYDRPLYIRGDASEGGVACVAGQYEPETGAFLVCLVKVVRFTPSQRARWSIGMKELWSWTSFLRTYYREVAPAHIVFEGDHRNHLFVDELQHVHIHRWLCELHQWPSFRHRFHVRGLLNVIADYGSRYGFDAPTAHEDPVTLSGERVAAIARNLVDQSIERFATAGAASARWRAGASASSSSAYHSAAGGTGSMSSAVRRAIALPSGPTDVALAVDAEHAAAGADARHSWEPSVFFNAVLTAQEGCRTDQPSEYEAILSSGGRVASCQGRSVLYHRSGRIYIPEGATDLIAAIIHRLHRARYFHASLEKCAQTLAHTHFWIPHFPRHFERVLRGCSCHLSAHIGAPVRREMIPAQPTAPGEVVFMDWFTHRHEGGGGHICIVVDAASRAVSLFHVSSVPTAADSTLALWEWASHYDMPRAVISDSGTHFLGDFQRFLEEMSIDHRLGTPHNSQGRGVVERLVRTLSDALRRVVPSGRWEVMQAGLAAVQWGYNTSPHSALAWFTPLQVLLGVHSAASTIPRAPEEALLPGSAAPAFTRGEAHAAVQALAGMASEAESFSRAAASAAPPPSFEVGSMVLLFLPSAASFSRQSPFHGPYVVAARGEHSDGSPTGFYTLREALAGHTEATPRLGAPVERHASALRPFRLGDGQEVSDVLEARLPAGLYLVERILEGPDAAGAFLVKFRSGVQQWLPRRELKSNVLLAEYLRARGSSSAPSPSAPTAGSKRRGRSPKRATVDGKKPDATRAEECAARDDSSSAASDASLSGAAASGSASASSAVGASFSGHGGVGAGGSARAAATASVMPTTARASGALSPTGQTGEASMSGPSSSGTPASAAAASASSSPSSRFSAGGGEASQAPAASVRPRTRSRSGGRK